MNKQLLNYLFYKIKFFCKKNNMTKFSIKIIL